MTDDLDRSRNLLRSWLSHRRSRLDAQQAEDALAKPLRLILDDLPDHELWVDEDSVRRGAALRDPAAARYLDFETMADSLIVAAAKAGLLSLNIAALDGALASSNMEFSGVASELKAHVRTGARSANPRLVALPERGERP